MMSAKLFIAIIVSLFLGINAHADEAAHDYLQIKELSSKYAWAIDTLDKDLLSQVFIQGATAHYEIVNESPIKLDDRIDGLDSIYDWLQKHLGHRKGTDGLPWHFVTNHIISIDGDTATLKFYMHNRTMAAGGIYTFDVTRTTDGWRVKNLHLAEQIWQYKSYRE